MKVDTWLPKFPGYYQTIFEPDEDIELEFINQSREELGLKPVNVSDCKWDYSEFYKQVGENCTKFVEKFFQELDLVDAIEFEGVYNPKFYNFTNDSLNVKVDLSVKNTVNIKKYIHDNLRAFEAYIAEKYTSYDGFASLHSNDYEIWINEYDEYIKHKHRLGAILDFICNIHPDFDEGEMTMAGLQDVVLSSTNYNELTTK